MKSFLFKYTVKIHPHTLKAKTKGEIAMSPLLGKDFKLAPDQDNLFQFLAPNDETALEYLKLKFMPADPRPIGTESMLKYNRYLVDSPLAWHDRICACMNVFGEDTEF